MNSLLIKKYSPLDFNVILLRIIHRQYFIPNNLINELHDTMQFVNYTVNKIKVKSLNDRLFRQLCQNNKHFECLVLHTEVRWLLKEIICHCFTVYFNLNSNFYSHLINNLTIN